MDVKMCFQTPVKLSTQRTVTITQNKNHPRSAEGEWLISWDSVHLALFPGVPHLWASRSQGLGTGGTSKNQDTGEGGAT